MRAPQKFLSRLRSLSSPFTTEQVQAEFRHLSASTISVYLSLAHRAGVIEQVGVRRYRRADVGKGLTLAPSVAAIANRLRGELLSSVLEQLIVWSDDNLAPFVHDGFAKPFVVIEGGAAAVQAVTRVLRDRSLSTVRNYDDLGVRIWAEDHADQVFLMTTKRFEATQLVAEGFRVPTLGRLLIPLLHMAALLPDAALTLLADPAADLSHTLEALPTKRATLRLGAFLAWARLKAPEHRVAVQAERLLPESFARW